MGHRDRFYPKAKTSSLVRIFLICFLCLAISSFAKQLEWSVSETNNNIDCSYESTCFVDASGHIFINNTSNVTPIFSINAYFSSGNDLVAFETDENNNAVDNSTLFNHGDKFERFYINRVPKLSQEQRYFRMFHYNVDRTELPFYVREQINPSSPTPFNMYDGNLFELKITFKNAQSNSITFNYTKQLVRVSSLVTQITPNDTVVYTNLSTVNGLISLEECVIEPNQEIILTVEGVIQINSTFLSSETVTSSVVHSSLAAISNNISAVPIIEIKAQHTNATNMTWKNKTYFNRIFIKNKSDLDVFIHRFRLYRSTNPEMTDLVKVFEENNIATLPGEEIRWTHEDYFQAGVPIYWTRPEFTAEFASPVVHIQDYTLNYNSPFLTVIPRKGDGSACTSSDQCQSWNCNNNLCCGFGSRCCTQSSQCDPGEYCTTAYTCERKPASGGGGPSGNRGGGGGGVPPGPTPLPEIDIVPIPTTAPSLDFDDWEEQIPDIPYQQQQTRADDDGDGFSDEDPFDGIDNDGDGLIDEDGPLFCLPGNGKDDDGDGRVDEDPIDTIDNDGDGFIDEDGGSCLPEELNNVQRDKDDDGDGRIDEDPIDGIDNDGDGLIDEDAGMVVGRWCVDDDGDGYIDEDPVDAIDNDNDGFIDEDGSIVILNNGIDDDGDGRADEDPLDGIDNDFDGQTDEDGGLAVGNRDILCVPDISLTKALSDLMINPGMEIKVALILKNNGVGPAYHIIVKDFVPGIFKITVNRDNGTMINKRLIWKINRLDPGEQIILRYTIKTPDTKGIYSLPEPELEYLTANREKQFVFGSGSSFISKHGIIKEEIKNTYRFFIFKTIKAKVEKSQKKMYDVEIDVTNAGGKMSPRAVLVDFLPENTRQVWAISPPTDEPYSISINELRWYVDEMFPSVDKKQFKYSFEGDIYPITLPIIRGVDPSLVSVGYMIHATSVSGFVQPPSPERYFVGIFIILVIMTLLAILRPRQTIATGQQEMIKLAEDTEDLKLLTSNAVKTLAELKAASAQTPAQSMPDVRHISDQIVSALAELRVGSEDSSLMTVEQQLEFQSMKSEIRTLISEFQELKSSMVKQRISGAPQTAEVRRFEQDTYKSITSAMEQIREKRAIQPEAGPKLSKEKRLKILSGMLREQKRRLEKESQGQEPVDFSDEDRKPPSVEDISERLKRRREELENQG